MRCQLFSNENGAVIVIIALLLTVLLCFVGFAVDVGNLYVKKTQMQSAADAAVCGGGLKLPNQGQATTTAQYFITQNNKFDPGYNSSSALITFSQDTVNNPSNFPEINCSMNVSFPTYFMRTIGFNNVSITAVAEGILISSLGGPFNYTIFSNNDLTINGSTSITGSIHSNNDLTINGGSVIHGTAEGKTVTLHGASIVDSIIADTLDDIDVHGASIIGSKSGGVDYNMIMPDYSTQIQNIINQNGGRTYYGDKTLNGSINVSNYIFVDGDLTIHGSVSTTGAILATGDITIDGAINITGNNQLCLYSEKNISVNGASSFGNASNSLILYAPNGNITHNGAMVLYGAEVAQSIRENGASVYNGGFPITSLPADKHVKLIK